MLYAIFAQVSKYNTKGILQMIIYNHKKEFLGIEEKDLQALGFNNLQSLQKEVSDFADLFVKTPGHVYNFQHVHWIDFITCAESNEEQKVIISANNKNYKATIQITTTYLVDNPTSKAYLIHLIHLYETMSKESESLSEDIVEKEVLVDPTDKSLEFQEGNTSLHIDKSETEDNSINVTVDTYETPLEIDLEDELELKDKIEQTTSVKTAQKIFKNDYIYDPTVASEELGLPLELIEEFIQDFIEQAKEFKERLYVALNEGELNNLKILSHKLKGVAANLRIEDALETITLANSSSDLHVIRENLDAFYSIIAKLVDERS